MRAIALTERQWTRGVILSPAQLAILRREYAAYLTVQPSFAGPHAYDLLAGPFAGSIVLQDGSEALNLDFDPRLPVANLFYLMSTVYQLPVWFQDEISLPPAGRIFEPVVRVFAGWVGNLLRPGLPYSYQENEAVQPTLRGHWLVAQDMQRSAALPLRFTSRFSEYTPDTLPNRILRSVCASLANVRYNNPEIAPALRRCLEMLAPASLLPLTLDDFDRLVFDRLTEPYRPVLNLARLLVQGLSLEGGKRAGLHPVRFAAFLVNMDRLFEGFVAEMLTQAVRRAVPGLSLEVQRSVWLDSEARLRMKPDILLRRAGQARLVLDTKYKVAAAEPADLYQAHTYCARLGASIAWLLYPQPAAGPVALSYTLPACRIQLRTLNLAGTLDELMVDCRKLAADVIAVCA